MAKKKGSSFSRNNILRTASFFLLFAILSNLFYIPCYIYLYYTVKKNSLENFNQHLKTGVSILDSTISSLGNLHTMMNQNSQYLLISSMAEEAADSDINTIRKVLSNYLMPYSIVAEAGLTMKDNILFTRNRMYYKRPELSADRYFSVQDQKLEEYVDRFDKNICILPESSFYSIDYLDYNAFTVAWRWSKSNHIYFFATFPVDKVYALLAENNLLNYCHISLLQGEEVISSLGEPLESGYEEISAAVKTLGLSVRIQVPNSYIEGKLVYFQQAVKVFLLIMGLATAFWIIAFTIWDSRPLRKLANTLYGSKHLRSEEKDNGKASLMDLVKDMERLDTRINDYESIISLQEERLRAQVLEKALYRGLYTQQSREAFKEAYQNFPSRWRLALIHYAPEEVVNKQTEFSLLFTQYLLQHLPNTILVPAEKSSLLVILPDEEDIPPQQALEKLRLFLQDHYGILFSYVLSKSYEEPQTLAEAYQQIEYESTLVLEMGMDLPKNRLPLSMQQLQTMYLALSSGDEVVALSALEDCVSAFDPQSDYVISKYTYHTISNMLVMIKLESACDLNSIAIPRYNHEVAHELFTKDMPGCFTQICHKISQQRKTMAQELIDNIIVYINQHLSNSMLCINMITDEFKISAPTLQKRLQEAIGQTFSAYVENARLNQARYQLTESSSTVQEIAENCGYANANSFYKAYKRRFGEAPLEIRRRKSKEEKK